MKLQQPGRRVACPACRTPIDLSAGDATVIAPTPSGQAVARGGTEVIRSQGGSGESARPAAPRATPGGGTYRPAASGYGGGEDGTRHGPRVPPGRPRRVTAVERPEGTTALTTTQVIDADRRTVTVPEKKSRLPMGLAAAAVVVVGLGFGFYAVTRGKATTPPSPRPSRTGRGPNPAAVSPSTDSGAGGPTRPDRRPQVTGIAVAAERGPAGKSERASSDARRDAWFESRHRSAPPRPAPFRPGEATRSPRKSRNRTSRRMGRTGARTRARARGYRRAKIQRNVPLDKLLNAPEQYSGQLVSLERTYCVRDIAERRPDGPVRLSLIETDLTLKNNVPVPRRGSQTELDVDRRLADRLIQIGKVRRYVDRFTGSPDWDDKPAIVTLMVSDRPPSKGDAACRVVGMEFYQDVEGEAMGKVLKVRYTDQDGHAGWRHHGHWAMPRNGRRRRNWGTCTS